MQPTREIPLSQLVDSFVLPKHDTQSSPNRVHQLSTTMETIRTIRSGKYPIIVAEYSARSNAIKPDQKITFSNWGRTLTCRVLERKVYADIRSAQQELSVTATKSFPKGRVIAFHLEKLPIKAKATLTFLPRS